MSTFKGYVNVLKERFTRKSLNYENYQPPQTCGNTENPNSSSKLTNDYRRRSVSPFVQYGNILKNIDTFYTIFKRFYINFLTS